MWSENQKLNQNQTPDQDQTASRRSAPTPGRSTRREDHALPHRPQMSSGRLFLDRVARQQSPSPLYRQPQNNMHSAEPRAKGDISTLQRARHFYFALTNLDLPLHGRSDSVILPRRYCSATELNGCVRAQLFGSSVRHRYCLAHSDARERASKPSAQMRLRI
jgi:hypothetical protein